MIINKNLIGGSTDLLILSLISQGDMYGFEIITVLEERSENIFSLKEGTLYPILHKLENKDYLKSYKKEGETGRLRKYYSITNLGREKLEEEKRAFEKFSRSVNKVVFGDTYA